MQNSGCSLVSGCLVHKLYPLARSAASHHIFHLPFEGASVVLEKEFDAINDVLFPEAGEARLSIALASLSFATGNWLIVSSHDV